MDILIESLEGKKIGVAVSGGMDSMALLHWFIHNRQRLDISLVAINFDHNLRNNSYDDSRFVMDYCQKYDIPCLFYQLNLDNSPSKNIENAARLARYEIFYNLLAKKEVDYIATAHHALDNAESVLLHLIRGSGLKGVSGIRYKTSEGIIRPLLYTPKEDIQKYIIDNNIPYVVDETNLQSDFDRNYIRLEVLPKILQRFPFAIKNINEFAKTAKSDNDYINQHIKPLNLENGEIFIPLEDLSLAPSIANRLIFNALDMLGAKYDIEQKHIQLIKSLVDKQTGSRLDIKNQIVAIRDYQGITLTRLLKSDWQEFNTPFDAQEIQLPTGVVKISLIDQVPDYNFLKNSQDLYIDAQKLPSGCVIRYRQIGDVFNKLGGGGRVSLKEFFIDKKIPSRKRGLVPVVAKDNQIFAILGLTVSEDVKVTNQSQMIYKLSYSEEYNA